MGDIGGTTEGGYMSKSIREAEADLEKLVYREKEARERWML